MRNSLFVRPRLIPLECSPRGIPFARPRHASAALMESLEPRILMAADAFVANFNANTVGEFTTSGATINPALITGLNNPYNVVRDGANLFVLNHGNLTIGEYSTSGATINPALITGLVSPEGMLIVGSNIFVISFIQGTVSEYTTSGATINTALITGLDGPAALTAVGSNLFIVNSNSDSVGEYSTSGATINAALITGLNSPVAIDSNGNDLFVANTTNRAIGEYTTAGATINAALFTNPTSLQSLTIADSHIFTVDFANGVIGEYSLNGTPINASLFISPQDPSSVAIGAASTTTTLASSTNPLDQSVTLTAHVAITPPETGTPTDQVTFMDGATALATSSLDPNGNSTFTTSSLGAGPHFLTAVYSGDSSNNGSTSSVLAQNATYLSPLAPQSGNAESFFDATYYLANNPDVAAAVANHTVASAWAHFSANGQFEGRNPSSLFNNAFYIANNPDVAAAVNNHTLADGFQHFVNYGYMEARFGSATPTAGGGTYESSLTPQPGNLESFFDENYYLATYPDIRAAVNIGVFATGWAHFVAYGQFEGRNPSSDFNNSTYLMLNPDVAAAVNNHIFADALQHYVDDGFWEGRTAVIYPLGYTSPLTPVSGDAASFFDDEYYLAHNSDVAAAVKAGTFASGWAHFVAYGQYDGRSPSTIYNEANYRNRYPDIVAAINNGTIPDGFQHFVNNGFAEGRIGT